MQKKILLNFFVLKPAFLFVTLLSIYGQSVLSQDLRKISGKVRDEKNEPLPGVNIQLKGTTTGASTDANGSYTITVPSQNTSLIYSFIGYKSQELVVGNSAVADIILVADISVLKEVVVVG